MSQHDKWRCTECNHVFTYATMLTAPNPFDMTLVVHGCPDCKAVDQIVGVCAIGGCNADASCGGTHKDGVYRQTCGKHADWLTASLPHPKEPPHAD